MVKILFQEIFDYIEDNFILSKKKAQNIVFKIEKRSETFKCR